MQGLTSEQKVALAIIPQFTGTLSLFGSGLIIFMIFRSKKKISTPFRRIILALSICDTFLSLVYIFSTTPSPKSSGIFNAHGNRVTCNVQASFFLVGVVGVPFYSFALSTYFLCVAKFSWNDEKIQYKVEPYFHVVAALCSIISMVYLLFTDSFGPGGSICWIAPNSSSSDKIDPEDIKRLALKRWIFMGIPILFCFAGVCINMFLIYRTAAVQEKKTEKYRFQRRRSRDSSSGDGRRFSLASISSSMTMPSRGSNSSKLRKKNQVLVQSLLYVSAFIITFIWSYIIRIHEINTGQKSFVLMVFSRIFQPLLGFFNILIYTRNHVTSVRRLYPDKNWFQAFFVAIRSAGDNEEFREDTAQIRMSRRREKRRRESLNATSMKIDTNTKLRHDPVHMESEINEALGHTVELCHDPVYMESGNNEAVGHTVEQSPLRYYCDVTRIECDQEEKYEEGLDTTPKRHNPHYYLDNVETLSTV